MVVHYSQSLLELAASKPNEVKHVEQFLVSFILDLHLSRHAAQSQLLHFDALLVQHIDLIHELIEHYGLSCRHSAEQCTLLVMFLEDTLPDIPKCSAYRFAKSQSQVQEDSVKSSKYSQSRLRINRSAISAGTTDKFQSESTGLPDVDDLVCTCTIEDDTASTRKSRYSALSEDDEEIKGKDISASEMCCVCLDPLLEVTRALKGESLCMLKCKHVLHSACAHEVRAYKAGTTIGRVLANGSLEPDRDPIRCPICRCESQSTIEAPLQLMSKQGRQVSLTESTPITTTKKSRGRKKNVEDSDSELLAELLGMGFEESAVHHEILRTGGDKVLAVNNLLSAAH